MALVDELLEIEKGFWTGDPDYYREHVAEECLTVFSRMAGVMRNDEIADSVDEGARWNEPGIELKGVATPTEDVAIITYEATATRSGGSSFRALVSTGYVRRPAGWKMMFHQQTPLEPREG